MCAIVRAWSSKDNLQDLILSFYHMVLEIKLRSSGLAIVVIHKVNLEQRSRSPF